MLNLEWTRELSLDRWLDDDERCTLTTFLADPGSRDAEESVFRKEAASLVRAALVHLDERESHIIRNRYGLFGSEELTLEEIGRRLGLSRERVRQIEREAKGRLRARLRKDFLAPGSLGS